MKLRRQKLFAFLVFGVFGSLAGWHVAASSAAATLVANASQDAAGIEFFEKNVRPIFAAQCARCHSPGSRAAGLDLTTAEGFAQGSESGPIVNLAKPEESRLLKVIGYSETLKMPPSGKLNNEQLNAIAAWVKMGAPWPNAKPLTETATTKPVKSSIREFTEDEKKYWAFQPLANPAVPKVKNSAWVKSPIDAFVLHKLEEKGIQPAAPAEKLTLLRRASFDLTGLPPTEAEIKDFLADNSPNAFAKVVDRLLASPRYGEKWGRHWLDVARYADSTGNDEDHRYPHAWKYRDYVIKAFNDDMPYAQFAREQLAGDLIPAADGSEVNRQGIIATGFLALGAKAIAQQDKKKMLYDVYDEQVDVTSKAFLGMTMACARCHNHKFDPIMTKDYYSMVGMFANTRSFSNAESHVSIPLEKPLIPKAEFEKYKAAKRELAEKDKGVRLAIEEITDAVRAERVKAFSSQMAVYMQAARKVYEGGGNIETVAAQGKLDQAHLEKWVNYLKPAPETVRGYLIEWNDAKPAQQAEVAAAYQKRFHTRLAEFQSEIEQWHPAYLKAVAANTALPEKPKFEEGEDRFFNDVYFTGAGPYVTGAKEKKNFNADQWAQIEKLQAQQEALKKAAPPEPDLACAVEEQSQSVTQQVFIRGDYNNCGEEAPRAVPSIMARADAQPQFSGSGRLQFADWLLRKDNALPWRVMTNRLWLWHFGEGIVRTPDNFGKMGERPTHPELLDYLSAQFIASGGSLKAMHRLMMLSNTYQMASDNVAATEADQDNRLLSRFNRRRLTIEEMRDGLLAIDGSIDLTIGGSLQAGRGTDGETSQGRLSINPETQKRRTVYLPLRRANLPTLLNLFDFGDATTMGGKRQLTNVATQALFWLNSEFLTDRSVQLAQTVLNDKTKDDAARIATLYTRILNRPASAAELASAQQYIAGFKAKFAAQKADQAEPKAWQSFCRVLMASNDFLYLD